MKLTGFRLFKRVRLFPGVSLNISRSGVGVSLGTRGLHLTKRSDTGRWQMSAGLPGTGVSYRRTVK